MDELMSKAKWDNIFAKYYPSVKHFPTKLRTAKMLQMALGEELDKLASSFSPDSETICPESPVQNQSADDATEDPRVKRKRKVVKNVEYFQSNYVFVFIGLFLYCMITSPLLLLAVMGSFGVCYWLFTRSQGHDRRTVIFGRELTLVQQYSIVGLCSMPVFYIVGAGAALFWVLGASFFLIMTHAVFYDIHSLIEPEEESFELTMEQVV